MGIDGTEPLPWLEPPPAAALLAAAELLDRLGATGETALTLARLPLPPRLARLLLEAVSRGVAEQGCVAAALLGSGAQSETADLLEAIDGELDARTQQQVGQLRRMVKAMRPMRRVAPADADAALLLAVLAGFPDRVARWRPGGLLILANGVPAEAWLPQRSGNGGDGPGRRNPGTGGGALAIAVNVEDRSEKPLPLVRLTARCEPEWLLDLFPERMRERNDVTWNRIGERVEATSALMYDELMIEETTGARPDPQAAAQLLWQKAIEAGISRFVDAEDLALFEARVAFAGMPVPDAVEALLELCAGLLSFAELKRSASLGLIPLLEGKVDGRTLRDLAPVSLKLGNGRPTKVHYEPGKPPWIASRLQDFFGMRETPRIGTDRTPVVAHLLAPNMRAVQTTTDLAGFWERLYPSVRRELGRRYPRHAWPEVP